MSLSEGSSLHCIDIAGLTVDLALVLSELLMWRR